MCSTRLIGASLKQFDDRSERQSFLLLFNLFIGFITSFRDTEHSLMVSTCSLCSIDCVMSVQSWLFVSLSGMLYNLLYLSEKKTWLCFHYWYIRQYYLIVVYYLLEVS